MRGPSIQSARAAMVVATATAALLIAQQVAAKATRDALFLSHFDAERLPPVVAAAAAIGVAAALMVGRAMSRFGPSRCAPILFALHGGLFLLEHLTAGVATRQVAVVLYLHVASLGAVVVSAFWSLVNERFDPYTAKRVITGIGAGATFGGVLGGLATERLAGQIPIAGVLLVLALVNFVAAAAGWLLRFERAGGAEGHESVASGVEVVRRTGYLRQVAWLVGLLAVTDTWLDYVFKAQASESLGRGEGMLGFFALFYTGTAILTFLAQTLLTQPVLKHLGLGGAVALLPGSVVLAGVSALLSPGLAAALVLRGGSAVVQSSLYRSGYELLYTPLSAHDKRAAKAVLDVALDRVGTVLGGALAAGVIALVPRAAYSVLVAGAVLLCLSALLLSLRLHAGYVDQLAGSLRARAVKLDNAGVVDRVTLHTMTRTAMELDRAELMRQIEAAKVSASQPPPEPQGAHGDAGPQGPASMPVPVGSLASSLTRIAALCSVERARVLAALEEPLTPELIPFALRWLSDDQLARDVDRALSPLARAHVGQLIDALLDPDQPEPLRRRLPAILSTVDGARVQRGLFAALEDPSLDVRTRAAQALLVIGERAGGELALTEEEVFAAIARELDVQRERAEAAGAVEGRVVSPGEVKELELVFSMLGLCCDREPVSLSLAAILGDDSRLRGTALEYLDNVLPTELREQLWPRLRAVRDSNLPRRSRDAIVEELLSAGNAVRLRGSVRGV